MRLPRISWYTCGGSSKCGVRNPGNDLLSALIAAEEHGDRLTAEEIAECVVFLSNAGFSTTRNLIASAVVALRMDREQWELLVDDPALIGEAVTEALRYDCSLTSTPRFARQEAIVGKRKVAAGATVFCLLNAANRDPERFPDPDRFRHHSHRQEASGLRGRRSLLSGRASRASANRNSAARFAASLSAAFDWKRKKIEWRSGLYRGPIRVGRLLQADRRP